MWYISGSKMNPGLRLDEVIGDEDPWAWAPVDTDRQVAEARVHGNAFVETCTLGWQDSTADKRAECDAYTAAYSGETPVAWFQQAFQTAPDTVHHMEGSFYIIDIDDPELARGEEYIQERLTSHLEHLYTTPESEWPAWGPDVRHYMDGLFFNNIARGYADTGAIIVEPIRQGLGLPYEWTGAPID